jgi:hypothetical protein
MHDKFKDGSTPFHCPSPTQEELGSDFSINKNQDGCLAQAVEPLPSKHNVLNANLSTSKIKIKIKAGHSGMCLESQLLGRMRQENRFGLVVGEFAHPG